MITALLIVMLAVAVGLLGGALYMINKDRKALNEFFCKCEKENK
jgi:hypothetical protein